MTAQCGVQPMCGWQGRLCRGGDRCFPLPRGICLKILPFWCSLLLYKLQKLRWIPNIRVACGHWASAYIHQELSRKSGDLPAWFGAPGPAGSLSHRLWCIATTNGSSSMWVCNQGNVTCGCCRCWLSCFARGFSCLWQYCGNDCSDWMIWSLPRLFARGLEVSALLLKSEQEVFFHWCSFYLCLAAIRWALSTTMWVSVFLH